MSATGEYADPPVRLAELVTAFGANGSLSSICGDFAPALTGLGAALGGALGPRCLQADVVEKGATAEARGGVQCARERPDDRRHARPRPRCRPAARGRAPAGP
jgi:hypothetical protein